jgi:hypothetical protein
MHEPRHPLAQRFESSGAIKGLFREVEELVGLAVVVVDILLKPLDTRQALVLLEVSEHQGAAFGNLREERITRHFASFTS